ncbi:hypothetical protein [Raoultella terrigena]|uniref:hypothetical protein n=1 Tax=Raoultella terrigena TaxID=577 RepID=UPI000F4C3C70|nr:hypothetical protein [Raoultella terrigena]ROS02968.1 hypothetical protein EDF76_0971 [Raoultella terrigena]
MLDFFRDMYSSLRQTSIERAKSPVLGAFIFSWLGFNWQMIAILIFSKREIEERLIYIQEHYDLSSYLIGPLCTTALISFLLPRANKFFTMLQNKPNQETINLTIASKKELAEKQQEIAEIEAKKSLAMKIEERKIDENINTIKNENSALSLKNKKLIDEKEKLEEWLNTERELTKELNTNIIGLQNSIKIANDEIHSNINTIKDKDSDKINLLEDKIKLEAAAKELRSELSRMNFMIEQSFKLHDNLIESYPHLFQKDESGQYTLIRHGVIDKLIEADGWAKDML